MGSLAVKFRADADAAHARGEQSVSDKKATRVLDMRKAEDEHYANRVARSKGNQSRNQQRAQQAFVDKNQRSMPSMGGNFSVGTAVGRAAQGSKIAGTRNPRNQRTASGGGANDFSGGRRTAEGGSGRTAQRSNNYSMKETLNISGQAAHAALPYTQSVSRAKQAQSGQGGPAGNVFFRG